MTMKTTIIEKVQGKELPAEWARRADIRPDELVEVTIQPPRDVRVRALLALMDQAGKEAEEKGLTDEILAKLLEDA
jgi:hypothetical protein